MLGAGINFLLFNVIKISVGRLRPNFIAMCQPYTNVTNAKDCLINNSNYFFPGDLFKCNKTNDMNNPRIVDGRCSFYSGHSALSIYFAVFIIVCFFLFFLGFLWLGMGSHLYPMSLSPLKLSLPHLPLPLLRR